MKNIVNIYVIRYCTNNQPNELSKGISISQHAMLSFHKENTDFQEKVFLRNNDNTYVSIFGKSLHLWVLMYR